MPAVTNSVVEQSGCCEPWIGVMWKRRLPGCRHGMLVYWMGYRYALAFKQKVRSGQVYLSVNVVLFILSSSEA